MKASSGIRGMTLIEMLVGIALILVVFLAIFGAFQLSILLVFSTKAKTGAVALVNQKIEYVRGLSYDAVGTVGGIPSGALPQTEQISLNGITYTISTLVRYVDDPADGSGANDSNHITADYKLARVEADWMVAKSPRSTFAVTYIAPHGIESLASGGTLRVNVFNASASPVPGANVRVVNSSTTPAIDVTVSTNNSGVVEFPGTPPASNYQIFVSKSGYSSAQTYSASAGNPNPNPANLSVVNNQTSTASFAIDQTGSLAVSTWSPAGAGSFSDTFADQSELSATTSATVSGGSLRLDGSAGSYPSSGTARSIPIAPAYLSGWTSLTFHASTSPSASASVQLYYWDGSQYSLVPDTALAGNSAGYASSPIDLSALPVSSYPRLELKASLSSSDPNWTPEVLDWSVSYVAGPTPLPNVQFQIHGTKTIGTGSSGSPIYKVSETDTTGSAGTWSITPLEWDTYILSLASGSPYAVSEECPASVTVAPAQAQAVSLILVTAPANSLRVVVSGANGPLSSASVVLSGPASASGSTDACGQVFFSGIPASNSYTVTVSGSGFQNDVETNVPVSGQSVLPVSLQVSQQ